MKDTTTNNITEKNTIELNTVIPLYDYMETDLVKENYNGKITKIIFNSIYDSFTGFITDTKDQYYKNEVILMNPFVYHIKHGITDSHTNDNIKQCKEFFEEVAKTKKLFLYKISQKYGGNYVNFGYLASEGAVNIPNNLYQINTSGNEVSMDQNNPLDESNVDDFKSINKKLFEIEDKYNNCEIVKFILKISDRLSDCSRKIDDYSDSLKRYAMKIHQPCTIKKSLSFKLFGKTIEIK